MAMEKFKTFIMQSVRVWKILKKPSKDEFFMIAKVSGIGVLALGLIGFIIGTIMHLWA